MDLTHIESLPAQWEKEAKSYAPQIAEAHSKGIPTQGTEYTVATLRACAKELREALKKSNP